MGRFRVGVQLRPQHTTMPELRRAWERIDALEVGGERVASLWTWDHYFPLSGDSDGAHFEGWTTLAAMAATTNSATVGLMVACNAYRNPDLLADMMRTLDHVSGGRAVLGIGAGWFERDFTEYGYEFGTPGSRLRDLQAALPRIRARLERLNPPPVQSPLPILIGGGGEKVTLRIVAEHAHMWNALGTPETYRHKNAVLDDWCGKVGRDPGEIERTAMFRLSEHGPDMAEGFADAGAGHVIVSLNAPYDLDPVERVLQLSRKGV